ncbi:unnamed protein product [Porites evermanni]|uniref:Ras-related protein Rab-43 n=1 Tax=Porites evermanni TaxID=104178 RepID=A0ABN8MA95_9CNID|nr:unnamed protein product [Porites evermanni]
MTMLARWYDLQRKEAGKGIKERRPFLATECDNLQEAEKWRHQIVREVAKKVAQIQNAGLGEFRIRDLNDEINKLLREKRHWEDRIKELGGPDYGKIGPKMLDHEGKEVPGNRGYKYFGAAKDLPGVRELFEQEPPAPPRKTRGELYKDVDADYYGYRDEDDGVLVPLEQDVEKEAIARAMEEWERKKEEGEVENEPETEEENIYAVSKEQEESDDEMETDQTEEGNQPFVAHVPVPSQKEVEEMLVQRKKMELLEKYASETLMQQSQEAKALLADLDDSFDYLFKIVLIGDPGVGKTCIVQRFKKGTFVERHGSTIGVDFTMKTLVVDSKKVKGSGHENEDSLTALGEEDSGNISLQVWDTAGQERFRTITQSYYRSANAVVITYDITKKDTFKNVVRWTEDVKKYAPPNVLKLLVGNKTDISESREVSIEEARACAAHYGMIDVLEASAKDATNVENAFIRVATELKSRYENGSHLQATIVEGDVILNSRKVNSKWCRCG